MTRRGVLRAAACAGGAAAASVAMVGFGPARRTVTTPKLVLTLTPWDSAGVTGAKLLYEVTAPFRAANPGLDVQMAPSLAGNTGSTLPAILSGTPPDVIQDWDAGLWIYLNSGLLQPLDGYIRRDNMDIGVFNSRQLATYRTVQDQLIALPAQTDPTVSAVNLSLLDELGLAYPSDNWTWEEATKLWRAAAGSVKGKWRYGGELYQSSVSMIDAFYPIGWGGGYVDPNDSTRSIADSPPSVAALEWAADLLTTKVCGVRGQGNFHAGGVLTGTEGSWGLPNQARWSGFKWRFYPMPSWPKAPATFCTTNFWAMPAGVKHPDAAWELLKFVAFSAEWQRGMMKIFLTVPSVKTMWPEWESTVYAVAPPLRDKNIAAYATASQNNEAYPTGPFAYASQQAYGILSSWWQKVLGRKATVPEAMAQAVRQVDALEQEQTHLNRAAGSLQTGFAKLESLPAGGSYATPLSSGLGVPFTSARALVQVSSGTYTLTGGGFDVWNLSDNCTLACIPVTAGNATFTCRITGISNVSCPSLSQWAKFGLMARGDLSDSAAEVTLEVTGGNGVNAQLRFTPNVGPSQQYPASASAASGLMGQAVVTLNNQVKAANYLKQPVWLRIARKDLVWSFYTSLDGQHWTPAGTPDTADMGGCWVGVFACAHNADFGGKGLVRATFDSLSFTPTTFAQVGVATS